MALMLAYFKQALDPSILQRGRDYYADGRVVDLDEVEAGRWQAVVKGTEAYQVAIAIAPDGALDWACDCPYDWGPVCKHVAAVLYAIEEAAAPAPSKTARPRRKRKSRADKVREALSALSGDELYDLLVERARDDRDLAHLILARYGGEQDDKKAAARLVKEALGLGGGRHSFLDYWGAARAAKGVRRVLNRADAFLAQEHPAQAVPIYQAVIETAVPAMGHADDSTGALSDCIHDAIGGLQHAAGQLPPGGRAELFDYCLAEAPKEPYAGWDWSWDLAAIAAELATTREQQDALFATVDQMAGRRDGGEWAADFDGERAALIKLAVVRRQEDDAAVEVFLKQHMRHEGLRLELARFYLERGDLAAARQVCQEWLNQPPPDKPGLRRTFLAMLLDVAEAAGDRLEQIRLAEALFLDTGQSEFYERLKGTVGPAEWPAYRPGFLERAQQARRWVDMGVLYAAEGMWPALLAHVERHPHAAPGYHKDLAGRFPRELGAVYERLALEALERKAHRAGYREACAYLGRMQQLGQGERAGELVAQWREQYKQRRALLDELDKAFGR